MAPKISLYQMLGFAIRKMSAHKLPQTSKSRLLHSTWLFAPLSLQHITDAPRHICSSARQLRWLICATILKPGIQYV